MRRRDFCLLGSGGIAMLLSTQNAWTAGAPMSVDTHAHVFLHTLPMVSDRRYTPDYDADISKYLSMLDKERCTHGVIIQPSFLGTNNSYLLSALAQHPDRLRGIVVLDVETPRSQLEDFAKRGVVGIRLNLIGEPDPHLSSIAWRKHLEDIGRLGWQVEIQAEAARLHSFLPTLQSMGVATVVDHFGRPDKRLGVQDPGFTNLLKAAGKGKLYVKLSAPYRLGEGERGYQVAQQASTLLLKAFGPQRLIWGSDWPHTEFESIAPDPVHGRRLLNSWVQDEAARQTILADTAAELFKFPIAQTKRQAI